MLSDSEDNDDLNQITVNEHYAKAFQYKKEREELDKLKAKLGSDISESDLENEDTDSESDESEDEDGEELTMAVDAAILRTLARIKRKDPSIYESDKNIFGEEQEKLAAKTAFIAPNKNRKDTAKPVTMRQVALEAQLNPSRSPSPSPPTHVQEQAALRKETISAFHTAADDDDNDLLVLREKTKDEREEEEEEYRTFLEREVGDLQEIIGIEPNGAVGEKDVLEQEAVKKKKKTGKEGSTKNKNQSSKEEKDQEFLMSYILNRGWIDKSRDHIPTYNEITSKKKSSKRNDASHSDSAEPNALVDDDLQSDSSFDSLIDHFESSYNHRFEEQGSSTIPSYPRTISTLVRREDTKRKEARERKKSRKQEELDKKKEDVRRLKALKMREIRRKLEKVRIEGGLMKSTKGKGKVRKNEVEGDWDEENGDDNEGGEMDDALKELDLEGDWDPEKHDRQMAGLFADHDGDDEGGGEDYWEEDVGQVDEDGKPVWEDDIDIGDIYVSDDDAPSAPSVSKKDKKKKKQKKKNDVELEDTGVDVDAMNADVQPHDANDDEEEWDGTEEMRKRKLDEYMEEVYNLDFNDMVGDLPTRFNYVPVGKQAYALSPSEILLATDKELNEFISIKRYAPYKMDARKWDVERQRRLRELQATLKEREKTGGWLVKGSEKNNNGEQRRSLEEGKPVKKRMGKKERMKAKAATAILGKNGDDDDVDPHDREDPTKTEGYNSYGGNVEIQKSTSTKLKDKEIGRKRKRQDYDDEGGVIAEASIKSASGDVDSASQGQKGQRGGKEKSKEKKVDEGDDGKPKKKRRRKHKKGGEDAAD